MKTNARKIYPLRNNKRRYTVNLIHPYNGAQHEYHISTSKPVDKIGKPVYNITAMCGIYSAVYGGVLKRSCRMQTAGNSYFSAVARTYYFSVYIISQIY